MDFVFDNSEKWGQKIGLTILAGGLGAVFGFGILGGILGAVLGVLVEAIPIIIIWTEL